MTNQRQQAPDVTLKSVVSGRAINLRKAGVPLVLVFATQATTEAAGAFRTTLRERYPDPAKLIIASVVDVHAVPRLVRKVVENALANRYREVAGRLAPGQDARDYIVMLPDWKGEVGPALGLGDLQDNLGVVFIAADGTVVGVHLSADPFDGTIEMIERAGN